MKKIVMIVLVLLIAGLPSYAKEPNYCHDKKSWKEWEALAQKYPDSQDVQILHAVRIGLCRKIEAGSISFEVARDAFNLMQELVIKRSKEKEHHYLEGQSL